ncbi:hypothetical protein [Kribbella sp. VKM Ac-2500]|uniref:hypothetical protein n=1 Tax=Kribbella sp. VKM Ac-2500 TaxID=2512214 RepID=UPI001048CFEC|nr:hypothetical protein [Kribbella sp. VKM Ac-2500]
MRALDGGLLEVVSPEGRYIADDPVVLLGLIKLVDLLVMCAALAARPRTRAEPERAADEGLRPHRSALPRDADLMLLDWTPTSSAAGSGARFCLG